MSTIIIVLIAALAAFLFFWIVFYKKENSKDKPDVIYTCGECGESHCNCYKECDTDQGK
ncbi:MAG: hypothetical protein GY749_39145 [Desulfobacteraceae bacterium]|nr:hypothetical protein [Desulfobacteraceae bacterium]